VRGEFTTITINLVPRLGAAAVPRGEGWVLLTCRISDCTARSVRALFDQFGQRNYGSSSSRVQRSCLSLRFTSAMGAAWGLG
jgi:hypothetical protein